MLKKSLLRILSLGFVLMIVGAGCGPRGMTLTPKRGADEILYPIITAAPQSVKDGKVVVSTVSADRDGWLVIHKEDNNKPEEGQVVGYSPITKGTHQNVEVKVNLPDESSLVLVAILHVDMGKKGVFEFPGEDVPEISPITSRSDIPVMMPFPVISEKTKQETENVMKQAEELMKKNQQK
jgi:hypothetical protein